MSSGDFKHFLNVARGSAFELETQLIIARKLDYPVTDFDNLIEDLDEIQKMITGLQKSLD